MKRQSPSSVVLVLIYALLVFLFAVAVSSCSVFKHKTVERRAIDSVAVSQKQRSELHLQDSAVRKETIVTDEAIIEIEMESGDSADAVQDTLRIPVNGDDYFIPVKSKVKKVTVRQKKVSQVVDSAGRKNIALTKSVKTDSVNLKKETYSKHKEVKRTNYTPLIIGGVVAAALFLCFLWLRRRKNKVETAPN